MSAWRNVERALAEAEARGAPEREIARLEDALERLAIQEADRP